tara:strand:+ start:5371 stop:6219 length:849 start_codon:yes stop_codon:yes gene_type:complete
MKFLIISDFFLEDLPFGGGAEYNDQILFELLKNAGYDVQRVKSHNVGLDSLSKIDNDTKIIISNFINLSEESKSYIQREFSYIIYEHDHKYLRRRIPSLFFNLKAPENEIVNYSFYKNANSVFAQSNFHKKIIDLNLNTDNVISLSGNLWSDRDFQEIESNLTDNKKHLCSILHSQLINKGTSQAIQFCENKNIEYELIADKNYYNFLKKISANEKLIFLPTIPETFSRISVEAKMMGCKVITNGYVGAKYEDWFSLEPKKIMEEMYNAKDRIVGQTIRVFE